MHNDACTYIYVCVYMRACMCAPGHGLALYLHELMNFVYNYRVGPRREPLACAHGGLSLSLLLFCSAPRAVYSRSRELHNRRARRIDFASEFSSDTPFARCAILDDIDLIFANL